MEAQLKIIKVNLEKPTFIRNAMENKFKGYPQGMTEFYNQLTLIEDKTFVPSYF